MSFFRLNNIPRIQTFKKCLGNIKTTYMHSHEEYKATRHTRQPVHERAVEGTRLRRPLPSLGLALRLQREHFLTAASGCV